VKKIWLSKEASQKLPLTHRWNFAACVHSIFMKLSNGPTLSIESGWFEYIFTTPKYRYSAPCAAAFLFFTSFHRTVFVCSCAKGNLLSLLTDWTNLARIAFHVLLLTFCVLFSLSHAEDFVINPIY
jgi:hypothetical protein